MRLIIGRSGAWPSFTPYGCVIVWRLEEARRRTPKPSIIEAVLSPTDRDRFPKTLSLAVHELRTPVTVVCGYIRMVLKEQGGPLTDKEKKMVNGVHGTWRRIT